MQTFSEISKELHITALLVTKAEPLYNSVAQAVSPAKVALRHENDTSRAIEIARQDQIPVLLVAADVNWREVLGAFSADQTRPSIVLLCPVFNADLWSEALHLGAFEAISMSADRDRLVWTVGSAYHRWERKQLVRAALLQNPYAHAS